jgi:hypothetical protein
VFFGDPFYWYYEPGPSYYWYWRSTYNVTHSPGYWEQYSYLVVETSLYDAREDRLVWTAKSSTMDDQMFQNVASSIAATVTRELVAMDIVGGKRRSDTRGSRPRPRSSPSLLPPAARGRNCVTLCRPWATDLLRYAASVFPVESEIL